MAFFRFTRDKRGYEHFYLVQPTTNRRGKVRQRVLYWFRTPPGVKVGREPFDEGVRRLLEAQNPDVTFDWRAILDAPIPSADAEKWRERRRADRAARQALAADIDGEPADAVVEDNGEQARPEPVRAAAAAAAMSSEPAAGDVARKKRRRRRGRRGGLPAHPAQLDDSGASKAVDTRDAQADEADRDLDGQDEPSERTEE